MTVIHGFLCSPPMYTFDGVTFEFGQMTGPWPLRKDGELRKRAGRGFFALFER